MSIPCSFHELKQRNGPPLNAWGLYGPDDELGRLNLITPDSVRRGRDSIQHGIRINLKWVTGGLSIDTNTLMAILICKLQSVIHLLSLTWSRQAAITARDVSPKRTSSTVLLNRADSAKVNIECTASTTLSHSIPKIRLNGMVSVISHTSIGPKRICIPITEE
jgi:hypothetical protein